MVCERDGCRHSLSDLRTAGPRKQQYLREATELIEEWHKLIQGIPPMNAQTSEHEEVVTVERQRVFHVVLR